MVITSCGPSENDLKVLDKYNNAVISYLDKYNPELYISEINYGLCDGGYEESIHGRINCNSGELSTIIIKHLESKSLVGFERILLIEFENLPGIIIQSKPFYSDLCAYLSSGPIVVMILECKDAVVKNRKLMGATDPKKADENTIRKMFGISIDKNSVHGSDSLDNAKKEINFFFKN